MSTLHGTWLPVRAELDGEAAPPMALERMEFVFQEELYIMSFAGTVYDQGTLSHTSTTLRLTAQLGPNAGRIIPAIYQLAGDRLRICFGLGGVEPTAFDTTTGSQRYLVTYRRRPLQP